MNRPIFRLVSLAGLIATTAFAAAAESKPIVAPEPALVAPANLSALKPSDFADDELDLPYYLAHFHVVANGVEMSGPERGAMRVSVWRGTNRTYNARLLENILSLAWFYTADRKWNPYRGDPALRARLEAALEFWCNSQSPDGQFAEYGPKQWNLAATAFATKFVGEGLLLLHRGGQPIDPAILARADEALRRAVEAVLTLPALYEHGCTYSNQFGNVWPGGLTYFEIHPDAALRAQWEKRFHQSRADFQSPAGYYYERDGADFGYTMSTHDHNTRQAWLWLRGTPLGDELVAKEKVWFEWLTYNAAPEPDRSGFVLNRAIESRQKHADFRSYETPLGEFIPLIRGLAESKEERTARLIRERAEFTANWPKVAPLNIGQFWAYSPYAFLHRRLHEWLPTTAERDAARKQLPMLAREQFVHQFADSRKHVVYTFVRQPAYYAAFNGGEKISEQQRYGLGLVWTPRLGTVLQSQTASNTAAWGTRATGAAAVYEEASINVEFTDADKRLAAPVPGSHDLPAREITVRYPLAERGEKTAKFAHDGIAVTVTHSGEFTETLPLLVPVGGRIEVAGHRATLTSPQGTCAIEFDAAAKATTAETETKVLDKHVVVLTLTAKDKLGYTFVFAP